jgi:glucose-1-phosphate thymidylyltransferase
MIAILLCAGFATRMYPLTKNFAKPLLPVAGRPALDYLMEQILELPRMESIHLVTNARFFDHFVEWWEKWQREIKGRGISLNLYNDGTTDNDNRLGAVVDLAFVLHSIEVTTGALIAAGDNIFRFSLKPLWQKVLENDKNYVVAIPESDPNKLRRTGVIELGSDDRVLKFHEKPENPPSPWVCPALYFLQPSALPLVDEYLGQPNAQDAPGHFISYLVNREPVYAIKVNSKATDIGTIESYEEANAVLLREPVILPDVE